jgi:hypothetical protein
METKQPPDKVWTYDDLPPGEPEDGSRWEIFDGELVVSPAPAYLHQLILKRLFQEAERQLEQPKIATMFFAPLDIILSPTRSSSLT